MPAPLTSLTPLTYPGVQFPLTWATLGLGRVVPGKTGLQAPRLFDIPATNLRALANYAWYGYERERRLAAKQVNKRYSKIRQDIAQGYAQAFQTATSRYWASGPQAMQLKTRGQDIKSQLGQLDKASFQKAPATPVWRAGPGRPPAGAARYAPKWAAAETLEPGDVPDVDVTPVTGRPGSDGSSGGGGAGLGLGLGLLLFLLLRRRSRR